MTSFEAAGIRGRFDLGEAKLLAAALWCAVSFRVFLLILDEMRVFFMGADFKS